MIFRLLYNTYKEYFFIVAYKMMVHDLDYEVLHSLDIIEGRPREKF